MKGFVPILLLSVVTAFAPLSSSSSERRTPILILATTPQITSGSNEWGIPSSSDLVPLQSKPTKILPNGGRLTLLGAGPGDPDLLTVAAHRLLTNTTEHDTLVIADRLVAPEILQLIASTTTVKVARKLPGCAELAQEEIYWWIYQGLQQGKHVIRLKIGDPFVFGRGGEEILKCRMFGVEANVVPVRAVDWPRHYGSHNRAFACIGCIGRLFSSIVR